ncbi:MAG: cyclic-di-AMP receptor [Clostridia bacterium]|nr:cyclic-di-AMP receptor [Clostridia bacterium]
MKLMIAIVQDEDAGRLLSRLMESGFGVTKLATTGGFLRAGNTTLLIGVEDERLEEGLSVIEKVCKSRTQMSAAHTPMSAINGTAYAAFPIEVTVGGATVFVLSVDRFVKL